MLKKSSNNIRFAYNNFIGKKYPISLIHFVTMRCNARCSFCFIDFDDPKTFKNELTVDEIREMSRSLGSSLKNINITGGEPFARKDLKEIIDIYYSNTSIDSIFITSNGSLTDRIEELIKFKENKFKNKKLIFSYSLDDYPENHNKVRKIKNLFETCIESYNLTKDFSNNVFGNVSITVSQENYENVVDIYNYLKSIGISSITACLVRDEGVYKIPPDHKNQILAAYKRLTNLIIEDINSGQMIGYNQNSILGRVMNEKNKIMYKNIGRVYLDNSFISPCTAGATFGVIYSNGDVFPCEILEQKKLGNLRDYKMNFLDLWLDDKAQTTKKWVRDSKCSCSFECAWSYNILSNVQYTPRLVKSAIGL